MLFTIAPRKKGGDISSELLMELDEIPNGLPILNDRRMGMDGPTN